MNSRILAGSRFTALVVVGVMTLAGCMASTGTGVNNNADPGGSSAPTHATSSPKAVPAHLGQPITIKGNGDGAKIQVTALKYQAKVRATDDYSTPDPGKRYVAVQFRIRNTGSTSYDDSPSNGAKVIDRVGQQFETDIFTTKINVGATFPASTKIPAGGGALGYLVFQVPQAAKVAKVQFSTDSGFGQTAEWVL
jgi:hypothetical protein